MEKKTDIQTIAQGLGALFVLIAIICSALWLFGIDRAGTLGIAYGIASLIALGGIAASKALTRF